MVDASVLEWCKRLIACSSVTNEGTRKIVDLCARELLAPRGIEASLLPSVSEGSEHVNLIARIKGRESNVAPLVLNTHLDTVPPGDLPFWSACEGDPFAPVVKDGRIYGLGAADTKLDFIAKVFALSATTPPRREVYLVATFGEEHGMVGAREMAAAALLPRGGLAFVGEASHLQVITAHKGFMVFELTLPFTPQKLAQPVKLEGVVFTGKSAHSSTPALGRNAIRLALESVHDNPAMQVAAIAGGDAVNKVPSRCEMTVAGLAASALAGASPKAAAAETVKAIPRETLMALLQFIKELQQFTDNAAPPEPDYAAPALTCNPGVLRSQDDRLKLEFELRPPPAMPLDEVRTGVRWVLAGIEKMLSGAGVELTELRANPGFRSPLDSATVELAMAALAAAALPLDTGVKAGCTEAGIYAAAGLRPVVFGPGIATGVIHAPNEYNLIEDVEGAIRFYSQLLIL
ncbi:MAG TPA: M20/M25/M40 family metallo-hydrolase [Candidatus Binataceae bacterium]|nr:M20/M25/M40 family metallo-hydrolase [Candidatus Binataceae bacterium]